MARRRRTSPAEDFIDLVALLPWWAGVVLAVLGHLLLHGLASQQVPPATQSGQISAVITQTIWKGLAGIGQYLVPLFCLAGAAISAWRRRERRQLVTDVARSNATSALDGMSWREFEALVGEGFRLQGYRVVETGGGGADGGVDLVLTKAGRNGGEKFLVQCKQWRAFKVGVDVVRQLYGVVDGPKLHGLIRQAKAGAYGAQERAATRPPEPFRPAKSDAPACPLCAKSLVLRTAKRGANAGSEFWGCTGYPICRGTRPVA